MYRVTPPHQASDDGELDFAGTGLFTAGSGTFTAQRHVEDLLTLTGQLGPDHTGS